MSTDSPATESEASDTGKRKDMKWYVVNTHSGYENKAKIALQERIDAAGLEDHFGEILIPVETVIESRRGEKRTTTRKFFPGYMLVQMKLTDQVWHLIKSTPKVTGFVGGGSNPPAMPEHEIQRILSQMQESEEQPDLVQTLEEGDNVRVNEGPFSNFTGVVEQVDVDKSRVRVLVSIFGRVVPVELEFGQVEKVSG